MNWAKLKFSTLLLVLLIAAILRCFSLTNYPAGFNADEAALGYNAYSLLETGKDEYGVSWPLSFKSFGDFKPGAYVYLALPFVKLLGLTELAVRLPSAILGIATVLLIYLLVKKLFEKEEIALIAAALLAVTPWHIHFSRGGWESNAATFAITLGVWMFVYNFEKRRYLFISGLAFLGSMYLYQSPRLIVPALILGMLIIYWSKLKVNLKKDYKWLIVLVILAIPLAMQFIGGGGGSARFNGLSFLADTGPMARLNELRGHYPNPNSFLAVAFHNKLVSYPLQFLGHYLDHFRVDFLFINGDMIIRDKAPEIGQFYLFESVLLLFGIWSIGKRLLLKNTNSVKLVIWWILTAPLASSLTFQTPNALRSLSMVVPMVMVMALGLAEILGLLKAWWLKILLVLFILFSLFEIGHFLESYFVHYPQRTPLAWQYGFSEMVPKLLKYQDQYQEVVITDRYDQPYILTLFYSKYPPDKYQPQATLTERDRFNFSTVAAFDKYKFRKIKADEVISTQNTLFVATPDELPKLDLLNSLDSSRGIIDQVNFPNGQPAFVFVGNK